MKVTRSSGNVFEDIGFEPAEATVLKLRSSLMVAVREEIEKRGITQTEAAKLLGVTQPRVSDLMRGKISVFNVESLVTMLEKLGVDVSLSVSPARTVMASAGAYSPATGMNFRSKD